MTNLIKLQLDTTLTTVNNANQFLNTFENITALNAERIRTLFAKGEIVLDEKAAMRVLNRLEYGTGYNDFTVAVVVIKDFNYSGFVFQNGDSKSVEVEVSVKIK